MFIKSCAQCGTSFQTRKRQKKYCSRACYFASPTFKRLDKTCPICGQSFWPRHNYTIYCSKSCFNKAQTGRPNRENTVKHIQKICAHCKKEFSVVPSLRYRKYCSQECYGLSRIGKPFNVKENNGQWKGGVTSIHEMERKGWRYKDWRKAVFERDDYTCRKCGKRGAHLHAHHLYKFSDYKHLRHNVSNGHTLCHDCHKAIMGRENEYLISIGLNPTRPPLF